MGRNTGCCFLFKLLGYRQLYNDGNFTISSTNTYTFPQGLYSGFVSTMWCHDINIFRSTFVYHPLTGIFFRGKVLSSLSSHRGLVPQSRVSPETFSLPAHTSLQSRLGGLDDFTISGTPTGLKSIFKCFSNLKLTPYFESWTTVSPVYEVLVNQGPRLRFFDTFRTPKFTHPEPRRVRLLWGSRVDTPVVWVDPYAGPVHTSLCVTLSLPPTKTYHLNTYLY